MKTAVTSVAEADPRADCISATLADARTIPAFTVLGVRVDAVQIPDTVSLIEQWIAERRGSRYVAVTGMHGISEALADPRFRKVFEAASLVVSDGMPLVWLGRFRGHHNMRRRVYGPELMEAFCQSTGSRYRHFFYGGKEGVPERLAELMRGRFGVQVAGCYSPPFRPLTPDEKRDIVNMIEGSRADVLWVGLGTPKQESWMYEHCSRLTVPAVLGVGAAFDLHTGRLSQAPLWVRENGLEWAYRLCAEPRRLWRRYLVNGPVFVWNVGLELLKIRKFN